jgi:hypothetical protein
MMPDEIEQAYGNDKSRERRKKTGNPRSECDDKLTVCKLIHLL